MEISQTLHRFHHPVSETSGSHLSGFLSGQNILVGLAFLSVLFGEAWIGSVCFNDQKRLPLLLKSLQFHAHSHLLSSPNCAHQVKLD